MRRTYRIGGARVGVRTTSREFARWLDGALGAYRVRRRGEAPLYSIVVDGGEGEGSPRRGKRFHVLYKGTGTLVRTLDLPTLGEVLLAELESYLLPERTDAVFTHAAMVSWRGVSVVVPGWLVLWIERLGRRVEGAGVSLPAATWVAVDPRTGRVVPPRRMLAVPADAVDELAGMGAANGHRSRVVHRRGSRVDAVCTYVEGADALREGVRGLALHRLASATANLSGLGGAAVEGLGRLVRGARCYEIGLGRPQQMLDSLGVIVDRELRRRGTGSGRYAGGRTEDTRRAG